MYKLGIDVGGTNTDAVLINEDLQVKAEIKHPTSEDIYDGIVCAVREILQVSGVNKEEITLAMLGTTSVQCHCGEKASGAYRHSANRSAGHTGDSPYGGLGRGYQGHC